MVSSVDQGSGRSGDAKRLVSLLVGGYQEDAGHSLRVSLRSCEVGAVVGFRGALGVLVIPALVAGISLRTAPVSTGPGEHVGLALRIEIPAAEGGYDGLVAELENDGGGSRYGDEPVPDHVGDWKQRRDSRSGAPG